MKPRQGLSRSGPPSVSVVEDAPVTLLGPGTAPLAAGDPLSMVLKPTLKRSPLPPGLWTFHPILSHPGVPSGHPPSSLGFPERPRPALALSSLKLVGILGGGGVLRFTDWTPDLPSGPSSTGLAPGGPGQVTAPRPRSLPGRHCTPPLCVLSAGGADVGVLRFFSRISPDFCAAGRHFLFAIFTFQSPEHRGSALRSRYPATRHPGPLGGRAAPGVGWSPPQPPPCPPRFPLLTGLEPPKVWASQLTAARPRRGLVLPLGGRGPSLPAPSLAAPRTCSPPLPTPQSLPGTQDFVSVDLFASSSAGREGRREAAQPGWLRAPGPGQPPPRAQRPLSPRAGNLETGQVSSWGRDVG